MSIVTPSQIIHPTYIITNDSILLEENPFKPSSNYELNLKRFKLLLMEGSSDKTRKIKTICKRYIYNLEQFLVDNKHDYLNYLIKEYGFIAGGFLRELFILSEDKLEEILNNKNILLASYNIKDIDIFFKLKEIENIFKEYNFNESAQITLSKLNNIDICIDANQFQLISVNSGEIEKVLYTFDFYNNCYAYDIKEDKLLSHSVIFGTICPKELIPQINEKTEPLISILRAHKFTNRGYTIKQSGMKALIEMELRLREKSTPMSDNNKIYLSRSGNS